MTMNMPALFHGEEKKAKKRLDCRKEVEGVFFFSSSSFLFPSKHKRDAVRVFFINNTVIYIFLFRLSRD